MYTLAKNKCRIVPEKDFKMCKVSLNYQGIHPEIWVESGHLVAKKLQTLIG
jgi:hypothetical protein